MRDMPLNEIHDPAFDPIQRALGCMAMGRTLPDRSGNEMTAIQYLKVACGQQHPLTVWLHLWPIFDPLRDDPQFKALIRRMKLPYNA
jgi:hypothetical protein